MNYNTIPIGNNIPEDIYVIVEISGCNGCVKYEINKSTGVVFVDRIIPTSMVYPGNYGYVNKTLSMDGDPLDVLICSSCSFHIGSVVNCRPVGLLKMIDESGRDYKIIAVPNKDVSSEYNFVKDVFHLPEILRYKIYHFFQHYKDLDVKKWVEIKGWCGVDIAKKEILDSVKRFNIKNNLD